MKKFTETLRLCRDRRDYPHNFNYNDGADIKLPNYITRTPWQGRSRKITLDITSFVGSCVEAVHYYGNLSIEGINFSNEDNPECTTYDNVIRKAEKENPLAAYSYKIEMVRPISQEEIDKYPFRWERMEEGDLTNSHNSVGIIIENAIRICKSRFNGDWELHINDYTSNNENEIIKFNGNI